MDIINVDSSLGRIDEVAKRLVQKRHHLQQKNII